MKKIVANCQYIDCTAIAVSAGDTTRQRAVLIRELDAAPGDADSILYGFSVEDIPDNAEDIISNLSAEYSSCDESDLATVLIDDAPLSDYVSGKL